jgi:hypothetical protein
MNTGLDEMVEATETSFAYSDPNPQTSRFLIKFSNEDITRAIDLIPQNIFDSGSWESKLQCFIAKSTGLQSDTTIECYPIYGEWGMGTGRYLDSPISTDGTSWIWRTFLSGSSWLTSGSTLPQYVTSSYNLSYAPLGGGTWYTGSSSNINPLSSSVTFGYYDTKDLDLDVTNIVRVWTTGSIVNEGFIIKQKDEFINNKDIQPELKYFSRDTHTIYPPALQFSWIDYSFNTGSSSMDVLDTLSSTITLAQNPGVFYPESKNRFRINSRPEYPIQTWQTSSVYTNNYYLPTSSYYAVKDLDTNEYVIDFDTEYTQISADENSSYFDIWMNGLEPERYYAILVKIEMDGTTQIFDNQYYFKVING